MVEIWVYLARQALVLTSGLIYPKQIYRQLLQNRYSSNIFSLSSLLASLLSLPLFLFGPLPAVAAPAREVTAKPAPVSTYSNVTELSYRARERFEAEPKNAEAAYNFAVYQTLVGDRSYAQQIFAKATELKSDDFLSHLGLGQMIANDPERGARGALVELARAQALALGSPSVPTRAGQLDLLGKTYLAIEYGDKALPLYQKAYALQPNNRRILQLLVRSALAAKNTKVAAAHLKMLTAGPLTDHQLLLLLAANCPTLAAMSRLPVNKLEQIIFDQTVANFANDAELFYRLGRNFEAAKCGPVAAQCFSKAVVLAPDEGQYVLAHCGRLVLDGKRQAAQVELKAVSTKLLAQEPSPRRTAVAGTIAAGLKMLSGSAQSYKTSLMEFSHLSCNCKIAAFNYLLRRLPGVVYARIAEGKGPHNLVIYDPAITSPEKTWAKLGRDVTYKIVPELSRTIVDFPTLVQTALNNYDMAPVLERKYYAFSPLPLLPIQPLVPILPVSSGKPLSD